MRSQLLEARRKPKRAGFLFTRGREMLTDEQLAEIEERATAATNGPWEVEPDIRPDIFTVYTVDKKGGYFGEGQIIRNMGKGVSERTGRVHIAEHAKYQNNMADAEFIAHAREDIPTLIAEIKRLRS